MNSWFFHDSEVKIPDMNVVYNHKRRLVKLIDKKTKEFKAWTVTETFTLDEEKSLAEDVDKWETISEYYGTQNFLEGNYHYLSESGIFDYTKEGLFFDLTEEDRKRALEKRTNLYI